MEKYTEQELFELPNMVVEENTEVFRFNCTLIVSSHGEEERVGKRKFFTKDLIGKGYIGFDAYNHQVKPEMTDRIRITYIGKDYIVLFVRTPMAGNAPTMHKVSFDNNGLQIKKYCGNGVNYTLITTIKKEGE